MHELIQETAAICPACWEPISLLLDLSVTGDDQVYVEDCQVCCNPFTITLAIHDGQVVSLSLEPTQ